MCMPMGSHLDVLWMNGLQCILSSLFLSQLGEMQPNGLANNQGARISLKKNDTTLYRMEKDLH